MKAKRAKRYRKIMTTYQRHYDFREPYQVLVSSDCLRAIHAFSMPIQQFFENTLHGKVVPYITQCTLAKVMEGYSGKGKDGRPPYLPLPMTVPLRYCKHKDSDGKERGVIAEGECLVDLLGGQAKGNEVKKNKNHFILAAADWDEGIKEEKERKKIEARRREKRKRGEVDEDARKGARMIPGVPIIYVKKSVMILEEPSLATEKAVRGIEKEKYKDGIGGATRGTKRKRDDSDEESGSDADADQLDAKSLGKSKKTKGPSGPNPLSVKKKKPVMTQPLIQKENVTRPSKSQRRRGRRGKRTAGEQDTSTVKLEEGAARAGNDSS